MKDEFFKSRPAAAGPPAAPATVKAEDGAEPSSVPTAGAIKSEEQDVKPPPATTKSKPKLKRKKQDEDPFASDEDTKPPAKKAAPQAKSVKTEKTEVRIELGALFGRN